MHPTHRPTISVLTKTLSDHLTPTIPHIIAKKPKHHNQNMQQPDGYQTTQQPFQPFLDSSFTPMSSFNRPDRNLNAPQLLWHGSQTQLWR